MAENQFDILLEVIGEAVEIAQAGQVRHQYGKFTIVPRFMQWVEGKPIDIDGDTYRNLPKRDKSIEFKMNIDIQEFNSDLDFSYDRKVMMGETDWWKLFVPGLETLFGKGCASTKNISKTVEKLHDKYVCVADTVKTKQPKPTDEYPDPNLKIPVFLQVFESRETCYAARQERFGSDETDLETEILPGHYPEGWDETWAQMEDDFATAIAALPAAGPPRVKGIAQIAKDFAVDADWVKDQL